MFYIILLSMLNKVACDYINDIKILIVIMIIDIYVMNSIRICVFMLLI